MVMDELRQFDMVLLSDGRAGTITDLLPPDGLLVDVGYSPLSWDNITCRVDDVVKVLSKKESKQIEKKVYDEHPEELESYLELFDESKRKKIKKEIMQRLADVTLER